MDDGQSCCENRYMVCDDPIDYCWHCVRELRHQRWSESPSEYGDHQCQFLTVETFLGSFTVANHNEHNGYYGGFRVTHKVIKDGRTYCDDDEDIRQFMPVAL